MLNKLILLILIVFMPFVLSLDNITNLNIVERNIERPGIIQVPSPSTDVWLDLDGKTGQVILNDSDQLDVSQEFTWSIWAKQNQYTSNAGLFGKYAARTGKRSYIIRTVLNNGLSLILSQDGISTQTITSSSNKACGIRNNNEWTMISITYNASAIVFHRNGVRCETKLSSLSSVFNSPQQLVIGGGNGVFFNGSIDDVALYSRALTQEQLLRLYNENPRGANLGQSIPVLAYHRVDDPADLSTEVSLSDFNEQMSYLHNAGFTSITIRDYNNWKNGLFDMPEKPVIITFDDGWKTAYKNAFPIMKNYGFVGTIFITTRYMGFSNPFSNYMNWTNLQELRDNGWDMESHSITHSNMLALNESAFRNELDSSKQQIIQRLNITSVAFVFPFHSTNQTYTSICGEYYDLCWTFGNEPKTPFYVYKSSDGKIYKSLRRINIYNTVTISMFQNILDKDSDINGEWNMNEGQGSLVYDSSEFKNDGMLSGGVSWGTA